MMDLLLATSGGEAQAASGGYVDDVFSAYTYTGNGSTQTINNGIDLAGKGGLVWIKRRSGTGSHALFDSVRGRSSGLATDSTSAQLSTSSGNDFKSFNSAGFSLDVGLNWNINNAASDYAAWTFRRAQKFFDVVTYTGDGVAGRQIAHSLGVAPGMVIVKETSNPRNWAVWHRSATGDLYLNISQEQSAAYYNIISANTNSFTVSDPAAGSNNYNVNGSGSTYVAYLFAHDPSAEGIIQCGSFTTDGSGSATVNLGWANGSQFAMIKAASTTGDWEMYDTARTSAWSGNDARLRANLSNAEDSVARISASGTSITFAGLTANSTYIYMAIRSPS